MTAMASLAEVGTYLECNLASGSHRTGYPGVSELDTSSVLSVDRQLQRN